MAALLRALRVGHGTTRALRGLSRASSAPQCDPLKRAFHCAALRLQDEIKTDKTPSVASSATQELHHQTPQAEHISEHAAQEEASSEQAPEEATASEQVSEQVAEESHGPSSSFQEQSEEQGEEDYETEEQLQARILSAALEFVPVHGWSMEAIAAGAESLGLSSASTGMFNGAGDLVLHFIAHCNSQLTEILAEQHKQVQLGREEPKKTGDFLRDAVETRLQMYVPYIESWPQAMSLLLLPHNIPEGLKLLSTLVDDMWYYAGDRSTDMNWYTKRAALTGIYNTTELVMVQDSSPDFQDTWNFLQNRIQDIVNMASTAKQVQSTGEAVVQGLMGAAVTLKNLTGMNQRR